MVEPIISSTLIVAIVWRIRAADDRAADAMAAPAAWLDSAMCRMTAMPMLIMPVARDSSLGHTLSLVIAPSVACAVEMDVDDVQLRIGWVASVVEPSCALQVAANVADRRAVNMTTMMAIANRLMRLGPAARIASWVVRDALREQSTM